MTPQEKNDIGTLFTVISAGIGGAILVLMLVNRKREDAAMKKLATKR